MWHRFRLLTSPSTATHHPPIQIEKLRSHPLIKRAMGVYRTVNELNVLGDHSRHRGDANYVRFFRRAKRLTFLQACAVAPLFEVLRFDALYKMASAFNPQRNKKMPTPLELYQTQLGFDGSEDTRVFLEMHGLDILDGADGSATVQLYRDDLKMPSARARKPPLFHHWLDDLQGHQDLGTVVNGGRVPTYVPHVPNDPFEGRYVTARESGGESDDDGFAVQGVRRSGSYAAEEEEDEEDEADEEDGDDAETVQRRAFSTMPEARKATPASTRAQPTGHHAAASSAAPAAAAAMTAAPPPKRRPTVPPLSVAPSAAPLAEKAAPQVSPPQTPVAVRAERKRAAEKREAEAKQRAEVSEQLGRRVFSRVSFFQEKSGKKEASMAGAPSSLISQAAERREAERAQQERAAKQRVRGSTTPAWDCGPCRRASLTLLHRFHRHARRRGPRSWPRPVSRW